MSHHTFTAKRELSSMLRTHKKVIGGEFNLVTLIDSLGHDSKDWSKLAINDTYEYWLNEYLPKHGKKAYTMAHSVSAHRVGAMLKLVLETEFKGEFEILGQTGVGRFGGPTHYRWVNPNG